MGQDRAEALDDDKIGGDVPPDRPLGVEDYGTTAAEEAVGEPLEERIAREEPEIVAEDDRVVDPETGPLSDEDIASGDPTLRDVATEHEAPPPAEEAALHEVDDTDL